MSKFDVTTDEVHALRFTDLADAVSAVLDVCEGSKVSFKAEFEDTSTGWKPQITIHGETLWVGSMSVPAHLLRLANPSHVEPDHDWDGNEGREGRRELTDDEG